MKYLGNKTRVLDFIQDSLINSNVVFKDASVIDLFSGTGSVSNFFLKNNCSVLSCDNMYYSVCEQYRTNYYRRYPKFREIRNIVKGETIDDVLMYLNKIQGFEGYYYNNYAPDGIAHRQYFSNDNAKKIDAIKKELDSWRLFLPKNKYNYLIGILMCAADKVSNTSGTYGAYLKIWRSMALKEMELVKPKLCKTGKCKIYQNDVVKFVKRHKAQIIYLDPPYNERQYASNFHVLENICSSSYPLLKGKTGLYVCDNKLSKFCSKKTAFNELEKLVSLCNCNTIVMSYSNEGILCIDDLLKIFNKKGKTKIFYKNYRRFKTNSKTNANTGLAEVLIVCKVEKQVI